LPLDQDSPIQILDEFGFLTPTLPVS
jgi:hypothetical protein